MSARAFPTEKDFKDKAIEYIEDCIKRNRFPNIAGFAVFAGIHRDTFYAQKEYYSDTYAHVEDMLEDEALQHNTQTARLYLMNKFGYAEKGKFEHKANVGVNMVDDILS